MPTLCTHPSKVSICLREDAHQGACVSLDMVHKSLGHLLDSEPGPDTPMFSQALHMVDTALGALTHILPDCQPMLGMVATLASQEQPGN